MNKNPGFPSNLMRATSALHLKRRTTMTTTNTQKELDAVLNYTERVGTKPPENNPIKRAKDMLFSAEATWPVIAEEEGGLKEAFLPYMVVVGFIPGLIGSVLSV